VSQDYSRELALLKSHQRDNHDRKMTELANITSLDFLLLSTQGYQDMPCNFPRMELYTSVLALLTLQVVTAFPI
jgi:hypothetical protein